MNFVETRLAGAFRVELEPCRDERGFFARTFCRQEFKKRGLAAEFVQCSLSATEQAGTIRGLHFQRAPSEEAKLVRCTKGAIFDVIVDLRPKSETYLSHVGLELTAMNRHALYVPPMFAHGFQALESGSEVFYQISEFYAPESSDGLRFDDPALAISWPLAVSTVSARDRDWPLVTERGRSKP